MTLSSLLGDKKTVNATLQYVATTGLFDEEETMWRHDRRIGDRRDGDEVQRQPRNDDGQHSEGGHNSTGFVHFHG
jgi:hypothetical protein